MAQVLTDPLPRPEVEWELHRSLKRAFHEKDRRVREPGWWQASSLGSCYYVQVLKTLGTPGREVSPKGGRKFDIGDLIHDFLKLRSLREGLLVRPPEGREFHFENEELHLSGYLDRCLQWPPSPEIPADINWSDDWIDGFILPLRENLEALGGEPGLFMVEDKSIASTAMSYPPLWVDGSPGGPKDDHLAQIGSYVLMERLNPTLPGEVKGAAVEYVGKDSGGTLRFWVDMDAAAELALARVNRLNELWAAGADERPDIAPCDCEGKEVLWCSYRTNVELYSGPKGGKRVLATCCTGAAYDGAVDGWTKGFLAEEGIYA